MRTIKSFKYAWNGLRTVWLEESNFRIEILAGILVVISIFYFDFGLLESALLVFAIALVLVSEMINTIVEDLCNKIEPQQDPTIGKIKDMAAGFVFLSSICSVIIGALVFYSHLM